MTWMEIRNCLRTSWIPAIRKKRIPDSTNCSRISKLRDFIAIFLAQREWATPQWNSNPSRSSTSLAFLLSSRFNTRLSFPHNSLRLILIPWRTSSTRIHNVGPPKLAKCPGSTRSQKWASTFKARILPTKQRIRHQIIRLMQKARSCSSNSPRRT